MLTKELRQEALKKGFHYPKVEKSVEFYRTKNLMIYDFVNENRISMLRVCIAEKKAGIYDTFTKTWADCLLSSFLGKAGISVSELLAFALSAEAKKRLSSGHDNFDYLALYKIDQQISYAKNWEKRHPADERKKEISQIMAGTNKRLSAGFIKFNLDLFGDCKRIMYSKSEKAVYCPECESISRISSPPKKGSLYRCPVCCFTAKVSQAENPLTEVHWSCIVQPAGKRSIIRYFCNDFSLQFGKCKIASEEKFRTILEADGSRIELMQTGNGWEDYKEKRYGLYYPSKRDVPYDMFLYGNVKAILKIPVYEHSMLDVWVKQHKNKKNELYTVYLIENYISQYAKNEIFEKLLKFGLNHIAHEAAFHNYNRTFNFNGNKIEDFLNIKMASLKQLRRIINDPFERDIIAMRYLDKNNLYLKDEELKKFLSLNVSNDMKEKIVRFCKFKKVTFYKVNNYVTENANADWSSYFDYIGWTEELEYKKSDSVYYPKKFFKTHDRVFKELEEKKDAIQRKKDKEISKKIAGLWEQRMQIPQYHYENNDLFVMMPHGTSDLKKEGRSLNHCVADYKEFVAEEKTQIFFIRKKAVPQKSFYTLEIKNHEIEQCHGRNNVDMTEEIRSFAYGYLKQLNTLNEKAAVKAVA